MSREKDQTRSCTAQAVAGGKTGSDAPAPRDINLPMRLDLTILPRDTPPARSSMADAPAVTALVAAEELHDIGEVLIEEADYVSDWQRPSFDLGTQAIGVRHGDDLVGFAMVDHDRGDAAVHPDHRRQGIGTALAGWMQECARAPGDERGRRPRPAGQGRRPAAREARLPGPLDQLGPRAARRRDHRRAAAARGVRRPRGDPRGLPGGVDDDRGRVPRVVGARAAVVRGLAGRGARPTRLRAVEHPGRHGPHRRRGRDLQHPPQRATATGSAPTSTGSPPTATTGTVGSPRPCSSTRSRSAGSTAPSAPSCPPTPGPARSRSTRRSGCR